MAPADIFQDDVTLFAYLESQTNEFGDSTIRKSQSPPVHGNLDVSFTTHDLLEGLSMVNALLAEGSICPPLPDITAKRDNVPDILAAALSSIVRLSKCCKANLNLRQEAERKSRQSEQRLEELTVAVDNLQSRISKKDSQIAGTENKLTQLEGRFSREVRRLGGECTDLKSKLTSAGHRENHLTMEARKRERQYTHLQQRVHSLLSSGKKLNFSPRMTVANDYGQSKSTKPVSNGLVRGTSSDGGSYAKLLEDSDNSRICEIECENDEFRNLLCAIQEELDDLILQHPSMFPVLSEQAGSLRDTSDVSDSSESDVEDGEKHAPELPMPAPSIEQMSLPFVFIRDEFEASLEHKFDMIRDALSKEQQV